MKFIEPEKSKEKLKDYLDTGKFKSVAIFWGHGIGDSIMFLAVLNKLKALYPNIKFTMAFPPGLEEEIIFPNYIHVNSREEAMRLEQFDLVCQINFPLERPGLTKAELSCKEEIGIEPVSGHLELPKFPSPLVAVHFNLTSLPELANPTEEIARKIWEEIKEAGYIPIEVHFHHAFDNPVNKKFDFVDSTVRNAQAKLSSLFGLLRISRFFVGVVSGPFHAALSILPHDRILYLEKSIPVDRFTKDSITVVDIKNYKDGSVKSFLTKYD